MRCKYLDRKARELLVSETENRTPPGGVPLSAAALAVLDELPRRIDGWVWGMWGRILSRAFVQVCKKARIDRLFFYGPQQSAAITGHKTLQVLI
jgi:hypothetical protein